MADLKTINVFLASSEELKEDRIQFGDFIGRLNDVYEQRRINVKLRKWEYFDSSYSGHRKQDDYNDYIRASQMFVSLFYTKAGEYTVEEYKVAEKEFDKKKSPKVYAYMKELQPGESATPELEKFQKYLKKKKEFFWGKYSTTDSLHLDFVMQFQRLVNDPEFKFDINNGKVKIRDLSVAKMANLPFAANNEDYKKLKQQIEKLENRIKTLESLPSNDTAEEMLEEMRFEKKDLLEKLNEHEQNLLNMALTIASLQGKESSERLKRASELFEKGDARGANKILNVKEIDFDAANDVEMYKAGKATMETGQSRALQRIDEYKLKAKSVILIYDNENRIAEAEETYTKAVHLAKEIDMPEDDYLDLIWEYGSFLDDYAIYDKALQIKEECLQLSIKLNGKDNQDTASCYNNLGNVYWNLGNYEKALENHEKAQEIKRKILGENHPATAASYNNLGNVYWNMGNYEKALEYYDKALKIQRKILGENHPDTATSYNNLGTVYANLGDYNKALENFEKSLEIRRKILGENHPDTAASYNNLGNVYWNMGNYDKALENFEKSLEIKRKILGENHPATAASYNNLGAVYHNMGNYEKALECYDKALKIQRKILGENHPDIANVYGNLGNVYITMKKYKEAEQNYIIALSIFENTFGLKHPYTLQTYWNLGLLYANGFNDIEKAAEYIQKAAAGGLPQAKEWLQENGIE